MKSSSWSSLLLGTILVSIAVTPSLGQSVEPTSAAVAPTPAGRSTSVDMIVDPAAAIDAAGAGNRIADEAVDRIMTGSIFPVTAGPKTGGLSEVSVPATSALTTPKTAPEPTIRRVAAPAATVPASAATPDAVSEGAPKAEPSNATATMSAEAPMTSTAVPMPVPPAPMPATAAPLPATAAPRPATAAPISSTAAPTGTTADAATPAVTTSAPVVSEAPKDAAVPAPVAPVAPVVETATPAAAAAPVPPAVVATASPSDTSSVAYSTASEPLAAPKSAVPVSAAPAAAARPEITGTVEASTAVPPVPSASVTVPPIAATPAPSAAVPTPAPIAVTPAPATPAPVAASPAPQPAAAPVVVVPPLPYATPDAAIAATMAAEQAAAALKSTLEEAQPRGGSAEDRADRAALLAFYEGRAFLPLFVDAQGTTDRARAVRTVIARADRDGLDPEDYAFAAAPGLDPELRAKAEIDVALSVVRLARHLQTGRFDPQRVSDLVTPKPPKTEAREVLERIAGAKDVVAAIDAYAPPHEGYRRLKAALAELRGVKEEPMVLVPAGPTLKPGQKDARVALLRERLGVTDVASDAEVYDPALEQAVKSFQRERGIAANGKVGRQTLSALNDEKSGTAARIADIIANMERWRWLPRDLGELHVFVNVPDFHLDVMKDGKSIHHARVIVGRPSNQTPIFSDLMRYVVVNPYWNVPYSIVKKEMIGKAQSTAGGALARGGYEVEIGNQRVDPTSVDWATVNPAKVSIRQRPGGGNALGNIKFLFPNQHSVYLHDTSSRGLFTRDYRALSHGCVRVHEPFSFADAVLEEEPDKIDGARLKRMIGGGEKTIALKQLIPVHIAYFTTWVDDSGQLQTRPDLYGHDARVKRLLGL
jgi:murein L,D-transpeptidase YcbB/YkuD